jgi:hypothetical protein
MLPYVISIARPCHKQPRMDTCFGFVKAEIITSHLLSEMCSFILEHQRIDEKEEINEFFNHYFDDCDMDNKLIILMKAEIGSEFIIPLTKCGNK